MTLCPIALAVGCRKCPAFNVCPVKGSIGDYKPEAPAAGTKGGAAKGGGSSAKNGKPRRKK